MTDHLHGRSILVAGAGGFIHGYVAKLLRHGGAEVIGPLATVAEVFDRLEQAPPAAMMLGESVLGQSPRLLAAALDRAGTPTIIVAEGEDDGWLRLLRATPMLDRPFAAHQVVDALAALIAARDPAAA